MPIPVLLLLVLAAATQPQVPASKPITVIGHAWAPFISPMGEPFRAHSSTDDTLANWFRQADRNHDGMLTADEMQADSDRFFATLDSDHDGEIDPDELVNYENEIAPDIQVMSRTQRSPGEAGPARPNAPRELRRERRRAENDDDDLYGVPRGARRQKESGLQGAARYGLLNIPEPVAAADTDFNRGISLSEFRQAASARFKLLDSAGQSRITLPELEALRSAMLAAHRNPKRSNEAVDTRVGNPLPTDN